MRFSVSIAALILVCLVAAVDGDKPSEIDHNPQVIDHNPQSPPTIPAIHFTLTIPGTENWDSVANQAKAVQTCDKGGQAWRFSKGAEVTLEGQLVSVVAVRVSAQANEDIRQKIGNDGAFTMLDLDQKPLTGVCRLIFTWKQTSGGGEAVMPVTAIDCAKPDGG